MVSERLGLAKVVITLDIYSHTNKEMQKNTANKLDDRFWTKRILRVSHETLGTVS
ncbi:hypothetical protein OJ967_09730 [Peribacillus frigoritolerans]|nr:hypothetical protein [Peribacillus frigoritolerans]UYZ00738.1 hypothetical protein OJ967_09730 [Peribacillus frigoritolerans]